jgi:hypothetical protein
MQLDFPDTLNASRRRRIEQAAGDLDRRLGERLLGLALSGSAGRGTETEHSDVDLLVVLDDSDADAGPDGVASPPADLAGLAAPGLELIPVGIGRLERLAEFEDEQWGHRWSYAWAPCVLDRTSGRIETALRRQQMLSAGEVSTILLVRRRLDAWINLLYRALKSRRDGRELEARLDAAESVPLLLEVVFALEGRMRPYNSYLAWSLEHHPLAAWPGDALLERIEATLRVDPPALVALLGEVRERCARHADAALSAALVAEIDSWTREEYPVLHAA